VSRPRTTNASEAAPTTNGACRWVSVPTTVSAPAATTTSTSRSADGAATTTSAEGTSAVATAAPSAAHDRAPARSCGSASRSNPTAAGSV
jgi:hypothetical protein